MENNRPYLLLLEENRFFLYIYIMKKYSLKSIILENCPWSKALDELLKIAGKKARVLGKNARVKYTNLKSGYKKGIHGLCPQGTQAVVVGLTGSCCSH
jgi:hypothetical protein